MSNCKNKISLLHQSSEIFWFLGQKKHPLNKGTYPKATFSSIKQTSQHIFPKTTLFACETATEAQNSTTSLDCYCPSNKSTCIETITWVNFCYVNWAQVFSYVQHYSTRPFLLSTFVFVVLTKLQRPSAFQFILSDSSLHSINAVDMDKDKES